MKSEIQKILKKEELAIIKKLNSPSKIQDFLDELPFNFEKKEETYRSPRAMLKAKEAHCFEGAVFAALCFAYHDTKHFLLDLKVKKSAKEDSDHVVCVFEKNGFWGAISKTNHSVLRYRDPIYRNARELAMSYFHEYFLDSGEKTLFSYSKPFDIWKKFGFEWITREDSLDEIAEYLDRVKHLPFVPEKNKKFIRKVGRTEIKGASIGEWNKNGKRV